MKRRNLNRILASVACLLVESVALRGQETSPTTQPVEAPVEQDGKNTVIVHWPQKTEAKEPTPTFSARIAPDALQALIESRPEFLPVPLQAVSEQEAAIEALDRIDMRAVYDEIEKYLNEKFADRFDPSRNMIVTPAPEEDQVVVDLSDIGLEPLRAPATQTIGFVLHDVTETEYQAVVFRVIETARQLLTRDDPLYDRTHPDHLRRVAAAQAARIREAHRQAERMAEEQAAIRERIGRLLGTHDPQTGKFNGQPEWVRESRRFSYIIDKQTGEFISRLRSRA